MQIARFLLLPTLLTCATALFAQPPVEVIEPAHVITHEPDVPTVREEEHDPTEPYTVVEQMPEFPGGQEAMMKYMQREITYPEAEQEAGIEGRVFIRFVVDREGSITDVTVLRGVPGGAALDREAVRVVKSMPKWSPGQQNGKTVATSYTLPVTFKLASDVAPKAK